MLRHKRGNEGLNALVQKGVPFAIKKRKEGKLNTLVKKERRFQVIE